MVRRLARAKAVNSTMREEWVRKGEEFRMPAGGDLSAGTGAGVRNPSPQQPFVQRRANVGFDR